MYQSYVDITEHGDRTQCNDSAKYLLGDHNNDRVVISMCCVDVKFGDIQSTGGTKLF